MVSCVRDVCRAARGTPPLLPFFVVNAATFRRYNAYARRNFVQLKLVNYLRSCAFGLLVSYWTLASGSTSTTLRSPTRPCWLEDFLLN